MRIIWQNLDQEADIVTVDVQRRYERKVYR